MAITRKLALLAVVFAAATGALAQDHSPHASKFAISNGVRLNYLDWGGSGPTMLFLPGLGSSAHIFDSFAPRFVARFHVMALSWRGTGSSDWPSTGYDVDTMVGDLTGFLDGLGIEKVVLVGHSMAGGELTRFAALHPDRVSSLVYLEAAYDRTHLIELFQKDPIHYQPPKRTDPPPSAFTSAAAYVQYLLARDPAAPGIIGRELWETELIQNDIAINEDGSVRLRDRDSILDQLRKGIVSYSPDYKSIRAPALAIYAVPTHYILPLPPNADEESKAKAEEYWRKTVLPWARSNIAQFQAGVEDAKVLVLYDVDHLCFIDRPQQVYKAMMGFLKTKSRQKLASVGRGKPARSQGRRARNLKALSACRIDTSVKPAASRRGPREAGSTTTIVSKRCIN